MSDNTDDYDVDDFNFDQDQSTDQPPRVSVWACPERPGPSLDRRDLVNGHHRNLSYGWTWWSARHIVALPTGVSFYDALCADGPVEVTVTHDVDPLDTGLNELHQRFDADWSSRKPEQRFLDPADLCEPTGKTDGDSFRLLRDIEHRALGLPRAVVRSDDYGRKPLYLLRHDWPDGTFTQGGNVTRDEVKRVFIEAFPRDPDTYFRGEGDTYAEAEDSLWARMERYTGCPEHRWETRSYRNGAGFCADCGLFGSAVFDLADIGSVCVVCGDPTYWTTIQQRNPDGTWVKSEGDLLCERHAFPVWLDLSEQNWEHDPTDPAKPLPDLGWMAHRLPVGVPVTDVTGEDFRVAHRRAVRDALDG